MFVRADVSAKSIRSVAALTNYLYRMLLKLFTLAHFDNLHIAFTCILLVSFWFSLWFQNRNYNQIIGQCYYTNSTTKTSTFYKGWINFVTNYLSNFAKELVLSNGSEFLKVEGEKK